MKLGKLQTLLETIYSVDVALAVDDFLITDAALANKLDRSSNPRACEEKLLVSQDGEELGLSLFIDECVLSRLHQDNPWDRLGDDNLNDFLTALEGVSHFVYLVHRANHNRDVTLLELELQAEVDKFVSVHAVAKGQGAAAAPRFLINRLFESQAYDQQLSATEHERYVSANKLAGRYCSHLESRFLSARSSFAFYSELRRFYEMSQADKLRHIAQAG